MPCRPTPSPIHGTIGAGAVEERSGHQPDEIVRRRPPARRRAAPGRRTRTSRSPGTSAARPAPSSPGSRTAPTPFRTRSGTASGRARGWRRCCRRPSCWSGANRLRVNRSAAAITWWARLCGTRGRPNRRQAFRTRRIENTGLMSAAYRGASSAARPTATDEVGEDDADHALPQHHDEQQLHEQRREVVRERQRHEGARAPLDAQDVERQERHAAEQRRHQHDAAGRP